MKKSFLIPFLLLVLCACKESDDNAFYDGGSYLYNCFVSGQSNSVRGRVVFENRTLSVTSLTYNNLDCSGSPINEVDQGSFEFEVRTRGSLTYLVSQDPSDPDADQFILFVEEPNVIYTWTVNALPGEDDPNLETFLQDPEAFVSVEVDDGGTLTPE